MSIINVVQSCWNFPEDLENTPFTCNFIQFFNPLCFYYIRRMQQLFHLKCDGLWTAFLTLGVAQWSEIVSDGALLFHFFKENFFNYLLKSYWVKLIPSLLDCSSKEWLPFQLINQKAGFEIWIYVFFKKRRTQLFLFFMDLADYRGSSCIHFYHVI